MCKAGGHVLCRRCAELASLPVFASSIELFLGDDELRLQGYATAIRRRVKLQPWLFVLQHFFSPLPIVFPGCRGWNDRVLPRVQRVTGYDQCDYSVGHSDESALEVALKIGPRARNLIFKTSDECVSAEAFALCVSEIGRLERM